MDDIDTLYHLLTTHGNTSTHTYTMPSISTYLTLMSNTKILYIDHRILKLFNLENFLKNKDSQVSRIKYIFMISWETIMHAHMVIRDLLLRILTYQMMTTHIIIVGNNTETMNATHAT